MSWGYVPFRFAIFPSRTRYRRALDPALRRCGSYETTSHRPHDNLRFECLLVIAFSPRPSLTSYLGLGVAPTVQIYNALYMQLRVEGNETEAHSLLRVISRHPHARRAPIRTTFLRKISGHGAR